MIPPTWRPYRRPSDGEVVGYLAPRGPALVVPTTLVGTPLGPPQGPEDAAELLDVHGLAALARRWWCRLPDPLPRGLLAASSPQPHWAWRPVVLVEVDPAECRVRPEMAMPDERSALAVLDVPVGGALRTEPPAPDRPRRAVRRSRGGTSRCPTRPRA
ncbi:hypothetical protein [Cellulomonas aerilata]|uniref:Uncharacterized protein n=1 Tax=Cellulomonas aerilata TaxID=515326 RepID=A0A512D9G0_9CELL|nr:hypothetical protein [Cellulomonas aerilata]GEO33116.1 hypothetical protein CAE01nite_08410 [Cellulomonas aerilata]